MTSLECSELVHRLKVLLNRRYWSAIGLSATSTADFSRAAEWRRVIEEFIDEAGFESELDDAFEF